MGFFVCVRACMKLFLHMACTETKLMVMINGDTEVSGISITIPKKKIY